MISTLERENSIEGMLFGKMKELPDWYGLTGMENNKIITKMEDDKNEDRKI